jgi:hypothetical protein
MTDSEDAGEVLRRWELFGGRWRVLARTDSVVTLGLFTCDGGQEISRVTATSDEFGTFLEARRAATAASVVDIGRGPD